MASLLDPYSPAEAAQSPPTIPGLDEPLGTNPALAAHQQAARNYASEGIQQQGQMAQLKQAQDQRTAAARMSAYANDPTLSGKGWHELTPEQRQPILDEAARTSPTAVPQIPGLYNQAQTAVTGRPVGVNLLPGETGSGEVNGVKISDILPTPKEGQVGALGDQDQQLAGAIAHYQYPYQALQRIPPNRREQILNTATQINPSFDAAQYTARQGLLKSFASGPDASNRTSANTLIGHLDQFLQAGQNLNNRSFTPWNAVANEAQSLTGNPNQVTFKETADAVATELSKLFKGTGAASDSEIKEWRQNLSPNASPEQIKASAATALGLMQSRLDALKDKYRTGMGEEPPAAMLSPQSVQILQKHGLYTPEETGTQGPTGAAAAQPTGAQDRVAMTSPEGQQFYIPKANVEAAKARGFK